MSFIGQKLLVLARRTFTFLFNQLQIHLVSKNTAVSNNWYLKPRHWTPHLQCFSPESNRSVGPATLRLIFTRWAMKLNHYSASQTLPSVCLRYPFTSSATGTARRLITTVNAQWAIAAHQIVGFNYPGRQHRAVWFDHVSRCSAASIVCVHLWLWRRSDYLESYTHTTHKQMIHKWGKEQQGKLGPHCLIWCLVMHFTRNKKCSFIRLQWIIHKPSTNCSHLFNPCHQFAAKGLRPCCLAMQIKLDLGFWMKRKFKIRGITLVVQYSTDQCLC